MKETDFHNNSELMLRVQWHSNLSSNMSSVKSGMVNMFEDSRLPSTSSIHIDINRNVKFFSHYIFSVQVHKKETQIKITKTSIEVTNQAQQEKLQRTYPRAQNLTSRKWIV